MEMVKIGVIGCGAIVQAVHLNVLAKAADAKVVALAEPDAQRLSQACARVSGAASHADWRALLDDRQIDAVLIALPTGMHAEVTQAALSAGKHVYLEKPLAGSVEEGQRVIEAWQQAKRVGMIGFNYRFNPLYAEIKRQIDAGRVGRVVCVRTVFSTRASSQPQWKKSRASGGGVLLDLGSHHFDLIRFMFGEIEQTSARIESIQNQEDTAAVTLRARGGVLCQSYFSLASVEEDRIEVYGQEGKLWADRYRSASVQFEQAQRGSELPARVINAVTELPAVMRKILRRGNELSYMHAFDSFIRAVKTNGAASPDFNDGLRSLQIVEAAERSARDGASINV